MATTIETSTAAYEDWLRTQLGEEVVQTDLDEKHLKMAEGTFPFLRATYWRWAETILDVCPELESAPAVLAVGDIHLENFGTWRDADGRLVWGVNDFDEAAEMPYALDLVRLATSAVLVDPPLASGTIICRDILAGYQEGLADPHAIVLDCDFAWLLDLVAVSEKEAREFWREIETSETQKECVPARYKRSLARAMPKHRPKKAEIAIRRRTAGVGSLGRPRWVGDRGLARRIGRARGQSGGAAGVDATEGPRIAGIALRRHRHRPLSLARSLVRAQGEGHRAPAVAEQSQV